MEIEYFVDRRLMVTTIKGRWTQCKMLKRARQHPSNYTYVLAIHMTLN